MFLSLSLSHTESMVFMFAWFETGAYLEASHCFVGAKEGQALINSCNQPSMKHDPISGVITETGLWPHSRDESLACIAETGHQVLCRDMQKPARRHASPTLNAERS